MSEAKRCPQCQAEIPAQAPEGLCPQCLLQAGLEPKTADAEPKTAAYSPSGSGFVPPTPETLQAAFPQLEILELLGKGGMGAVYKARQRGLDRLVAVKILPPEFSQDPAFVERFLREAKALGMLNHPNIVAIHDIGRGGGYCFFVMEYVDGVNLRQAMRAGDLKAAEALKIVPQICEALQFAHDEGIVHRDIKPENILLDKKGRVKIADFGLAKLLGKTHDVTLTGTQQVMGTLHYMAPEQIEGARDVDHRADIYSLGVTFYEMLTGELPIGRFAAPSKKVQIDVRLDEVVLRSLEKAPEQRYQHASEIKTEVDAINLAPPASREAPPSPGVKSTNAAELNPVTLLEATGGWKRWLPLVSLAAGVIGVFTLIALSPSDGRVCVGLSILIGFMLLSMIQSLLLTLRWTVEYRGHQIAVEFQNVSASRRLMIDGLTAASATGATASAGEKGWGYELRTTIPHGQGIGDEIVCTVDRGIVLRCRIIALPKTPIAPAIEAKAPEDRYQQASEIKTDLETIGRGPVATAHMPFSEPGPAAVRPGYLRVVIIPMAVLSAFWCLAILAATTSGWLIGGRAGSILQGEMAGFLLIGGWFLLPVVAFILNSVWLYRLYCVATVGGYLRTVVVPFVVLSALWLLIFGIVFAAECRNTQSGEPLPMGPREVLAWVGSGLILAALILNGVRVYRAATVGGYLRTVILPVLALCTVWIIAFAVTKFAFEPGEETWLTTKLPSLPMEQMWVAVVGALLVVLACVILHGVWFFRTAAVGGYFRTVLMPFFAISAGWLLLVGLGLVLEASGVIRGILSGPGIGDEGRINVFALAGSGLIIAALVVNGVWLLRHFGAAVVWKYLPFAWTLLCVVLFVMLWTPYATNRAIWSGYLDGSIWPHHEITECAVSLEPKEPTCKRVIIREKAENARSGYEMAHRNAMQPEKDRRIRLTYDIEVQPVKGESRQLVVDALNGMSWTAEERSGSILDAVSLAEWLREGDVGYHEFEEDVRKKIERKERFSPLRGWLKEGEEDSVPVDKEVYRKLLALAKANGIEDPEETRKKRLAAHAMQARTIVDIIQIASRDQFVFYYQGWVGGPRKSRLENATYGWGSQLPRDDAFVRVRGLKATESEKWEPVVPILYVGVPLMLGVWGVGLWLLLRRWRREAS